MILADLLPGSRILAPLGVKTMEDAVFRLLPLLPESAAPGLQAREKAARELASGSRGEIVRLHEDVIGVFADQEGITGPVVLLGVNRTPFSVEAVGKEEEAEARAIFLVLVPAKVTATRARMAPVLRRFLSREEHAAALLSAEDPGAVLAVPGLAQVHFPEYAQVAEAVRMARYRVFPESPMEEVMDLMVRRNLHALAVVGEDYQVLGIVTTGDALRHHLARSRDGREGCLARDVMTRAVLCVSEDQELRDVAQLMINRDVEQLPVVREGQFVGFVTRDSVLATLFGEDTGPD